jgi:hypothetical protein
MAFLAISAPMLLPIMTTAAYRLLDHCCSISWLISFAISSGEAFEVLVQG